MTESTPYALIFTRPARRDLSARLPEAAATAVIEFMYGPLISEPHRVTKPLEEPFAGRNAARRGEYRIICRISDEARTVTVLRIEHRRDACRRQ